MPIVQKPLTIGLAVTAIVLSAYRLYNSDIATSLDSIPYGGVKNNNAQPLSAIENYKIDTFNSRGSVGGSDDMPDAWYDDTIAEDTSEILSSLEHITAQPTAELNAVLNSAEFNRLRRLLGRDTAARLATLDKLQQVAGTPYGAALTRALAMSANPKELPEVKILAMGLLRTGNKAKQLDALHLLKHTNIQDSDTRAYVMELLQRSQGGDTSLTLAALETLRGSRELSAERRSELFNTLLPYLGSDDVTLRAGSLRAMAQAGGNGAEALQAFTAAALGEENPGVRAIAIAALGEAKFRFEDVRETLLNILADPNESGGIKAVAGQAIAAYSLDNDTEARGLYQDYTLAQQGQEKQNGFMN
ncbi:HEAT repeat domain-containing protein [Methylococcaceae bacterium WWC4]|nr:HEAT repeat domain-containing protein [Methylococcaceae bacterium WWC4]